MADGAPTESQITSAQVNIFKDLRTQNSLEPKPGLPVPENQFREYVVKYSTQAYDELTNVVGLDGTKIDPIKNGNSVVLDPKEKQKMVDHVFSVTGISRVIKQYGEFNYLGPKSFRTGIFIQEALRAMKTDLNVVINGPLVTFEFKSSKAMDLFKAISSGSPVGIFLPLPLGGKDAGGEPKLSQVTYLNFLDLEAEKRNGQNVAQHEQWHTIDHFRQLVYLLELRDNPQFRATSLYDENPNKFLERLGNYFYNPQQLRQELESLRTQNPELYDYYVKIAPEDAESTLLLQKGQSESTACIAGYLKEDNPQGITEEQEAKIVELILKGYLPFGRIDIEGLERMAVKDEDGRSVIDERYIDDVFNPGATMIGEPPKEWIAILDKYSSQTSRWSGREITNRGQYTADMQAMVDYFLNPGGFGFETMNKVRTNLRKSVDSYRQLSQLRGNPYRALFELSLLPISHWNVYLQRANKTISQSQVAQTS